LFVSDGSSIPHRQLGRLLREAREAAGISMKAASASLEWSIAKMYRVEAGTAPLRTPDITTMCALYEVAPEMQDLLIKLAREGKEGAWWHTYGAALPSWFELYVGMEAYAMRLRRYDAGIIPGLLQTAEYAEELMRRVESFTDEEIAAKVAIRLERQRIFDRRRPAPPKVEILLDEVALRRPLRRRDDWRQQLIHIQQMAARPMVSVQVLPICVPPDPMLSAGSFTVMDFYPVGMRTPDPSTIYYEGMTGALYIDRPEEVDTYLHRWNRLNREAMSPQGSADFISGLIKENE